MAIGVFDSGLGGISVYKKIKEKYPDEKIIYFADNANFPYGEKTKEEIVRFSRNIIDFFKNEGVTSIVIACNTATACSLDIVEKEYNIPILGVIKPVSEHIKNNNIENITILATNATINSGAYDTYIGKNIIKKLAAPKLVLCAENREEYNVNEVLDIYLKDVEKHSNVLLACTHFPLLEKEIKENYETLNLIDPAVYIVKKMKVFSEKGEDVFYTSKDLENFKIKLKKILSKEELDVRLHKW